MTTDILLLGTGAFAGRIACDLAAAAKEPVRIVIAGRNGPRLAWLRTASNARAAIFGTAARFSTEQLDLLNQAELDDLIGRLRPNVVVQAASVQTSSVIAATGDGWSKLVAEGGLSATAVFQTVISAAASRAVLNNHPRAHVINCCFPDVVNGLLKAMGLPVTCGVGNVSILANSFAGVLNDAEGAAPDLRVLAHYQTIGAWRRPAAERAGQTPRVWVSDQEVDDVFDRFKSVQLTPEPAIEVSGGAGVPLMLSIAAGRTWVGHAPGPLGLPGGYPVVWRDGALSLNLPTGLSEAQAVIWNAQFEASSGMVVEGGKVRYTGKLAERLRDHGVSVADGFEVSDLDAAYHEMKALRDRLQA